MSYRDRDLVTVVEELEARIAVLEKVPQLSAEVRRSQRFNSIVNATATITYIAVLSIWALEFCNK